MSEAAKQSTGMQVAGATIAYLVMAGVGALAAYFITRSTTQRAGVNRNVFLGDMTMTGALIGVVLSAALYIAYFRPHVLSK